MNDPISPLQVKPSFDIGRVFNRTFGAIKNNLGSFCLASFFIVGIPQFLFGIAPIFMGAFDGSSPTLEAVIIPLALLGIISAIIIVLLQFILQGTIIHASISDFNGEFASFKDSMAVARKHLWPLIGFAILASLGMMGGLLLFVVPGIIFMLMWSVGVPALVIENTGVSRAFSRSSYLTSGYKWWILLLVLIFALIGGIIAAVGAVFTAPLGGGLQEVLLGGGSPTTSYFLVSATINAAVQALSTMVSAAGTAAIYFELRYLKEGAGPKALAAVFD